MKRINRILVLFFVFAILCGSFANLAFAKHANSNLLGRAFCNPTSEAIQQAKELNAIRVGIVADVSPAKDFANAMRVEKTVGRPHLDTMFNAFGDYDKYVKKCGLDSVAGKYFEWDNCRKFNEEMRGHYYAETTASLGSSGDPVDVIYRDWNTNEQMCRAQYKLSASEAIDAIINPKRAKNYKDCIIYTPTDQLRIIKEDLAHETNKVVPKDPYNRQLIYDAINKSEKFDKIYSPKLTDSILGFISDSKGNIINDLMAPNSPYRKLFNEQWSAAIQAIQNGDKYIKYEGILLGYTDSVIKDYKANGKMIPSIEKALASRDVSLRNANMSLGTLYRTPYDTKWSVAKRAMRNNAVFIKDGRTILGQTNDFIKGYKVNGKYVRSTFKFIEGSKASGVAVKFENALRAASKSQNLVKIMPLANKAIFIEGSKASGAAMPEIAEAAFREAQKAHKFKALPNKVFGYAVAVIDIGYGVYMIYDAESKFQKGLLDDDLSNYKKILGVVQIGVGVIELVAESVPVIDPVVTPVVIVVSIAIVALDIWIDYIQAQRIAARERLIERVTETERPYAIYNWLIREMDTQCAL